MSIVVLGFKVYQTSYSGYGRDVSCNLTFFSVYGTAAHFHYHPLRKWNPACLSCLLFKASMHKLLKYCMQMYADLMV